MGAFLDKPKTEKYNECGGGAGLRYGLSSMQGWRIEMEDAHSAVIGLPEVGDHVSWFAVFDGHAGSRVSAHCSRHLLDCVLAASVAEKKDDDDDRPATDDDSPHAEELKSVLRAEHSEQESAWFAKVRRGILQGFLQLDEKLRKIPEVANGEDKSGTTAVCALITDKYVLFSNCGDSRGVLSSGGGRPVLVTEDHKPSNPPERERIQNAGGSVMIQRVNGSLAVSRALGDFEYKNVDGKGPTEQLVSPEPEFYLRQRHHEEDEFLVLACDGVWDVMSNEDICEFVSARMKITEDLEAIANEVIDTCLHKGSRDNMSIIIIAFPAAPKVCQEALQQERSVQDLLKEKVVEIVREYDNDVEFQTVFQKLTDETISGLTSGGGIYSKKEFLEDVFYTLCPDKRNVTKDPCPNPLASLLFTNANKSSSLS